MMKNDAVSYWLKSASDALKTAEGLFTLGHFHYCLFFCHLALEKLLKGLILKKTNNHAPLIHDLAKLAKVAGLILSAEKKKNLEEISTWNIKARYDNIKFDFHKKATRGFTSRWFTKVKEIYLWIKNQY